MSFTKVGPIGGWAMGAKLTSAQMNQLDSDHALALDKSVAGDTLSGVVLMASTAQIAASNADNIIATAAGAITTGATGGIKSIVVAGITTTQAGGIAPQVAAGITDGGIATGIQATIADGIDAGVAKGIQSHVADGISGNALGAIQADAAGALRSAVVGGIQLAGGATDWPTFSAARNRVKMITFQPQGGLASGWTLSAPLPGVIGPGTSTSQFFDLTPQLHNGATLQNFNIYFIVNNSHSGGAPQNLPSATILRFPVLTPSSYVYLNSGTSVSATNPGGTGTSWYDSANPQEWNYLCNQNNVIDTTQYMYALQITDENGTNAESDTQYMYAQAQFTGISNMQFQ